MLICFVIEPEKNFENNHNANLGSLRATIIMIEAKFFTVGTYLYKYNLTVLFVSPSKIAHDKFYIYCPPLLLIEIYAHDVYGATLGSSCAPRVQLIPHCGMFSHSLIASSNVVIHEILALRYEPSNLAAMHCQWDFRLIFRPLYDYRTPDRLEKI